MNPNLTDYDKILAVLVVAIAHCIILINFINSKVKAFDNNTGKFSIFWFFLVVVAYVVSVLFYITLIQFMYYSVPYFSLFIVGIIFVCVFLYLLYLITFKCKLSLSVKIDKK